MISVDFYILPDEQPASLQTYACKLAERHWRAGQRVLIQTDCADDSQSLDDLLWQGDDATFIPHGIATREPDDQQHPILIAHQKISNDPFQSIINLSSRPADVTAQQDETHRIEEILNQNEQRKHAGREHYKTYRAAGYTLQHHTLETSDG